MTTNLPLPTLPLKAQDTIHFIGIGGIGMSGIAEVLHDLGFNVQGSDLKESLTIFRLREKGVHVFIGQTPENIQQQVSVCVISSAIKEDNAELRSAREKQIPIIHRSQMLAELMRLRWGIAIGGTHGKTTTTTIMATLLDRSGFEPTVINGGIINAYGTNARLGSGEWIVAEADESDGSFTRLPARIVVITNIDKEHLDHYQTVEALEESFYQFASSVPFYGLAILCQDDPMTAKLIQRLSESDRRFWTYGFSPESHIQCTSLRVDSQLGGTFFDIRIKHPHSPLTSEHQNLFLPMVGHHNVSNCLATIAVAHHLNISMELICSSLQQFSGVKRRFTYIGKHEGATIIEDYAHHPRELSAVLDAAAMLDHQRLIIVHQPHRFSRLNNLMEDFTTCFNCADEVLLLPVFSAGEQPIPHALHTDLTDNINNQSSNSIEETTVTYPKAISFNFEAELYLYLKGTMKPGDIILFTGAGSISQFAYEFYNHIHPLALEEAVYDK